MSDKCIKMHCVYVWHSSIPVAMFKDVKEAESWGIENYYGQWLIKDRQIPEEFLQFMTVKEYEDIKPKAKELYDFLNKKEE